MLLSFESERARELTEMILPLINYRHHMVVRRALLAPLNYHILEIEADTPLGVWKQGVWPPTEESLLAGRPR